MNKLIMTLTGPSASGKSTLEQMLVDTGVFERAISTTTRKMREGEVQGQAYHFVERDDFEHAVMCGEMVEHVEFAGNLYGLHAIDVNRCFAQGKPVVAVVEPEGCRQISEYARKKGWTHLPVFITNDAPILIERFMARDPNMNQNELARRLENLVTKELNWIEYHHWSFVVERFDQDNQDDVVAFLCNHVRLRSEVA